jgi:hypothetical protein
MTDTPAVVKVPVKQWWESKINWTQLIGTAAMVAAYLGYIVPPDLVPATVTAIASVQAAVTLVLRTWFTKDVVAQAVTNTNKG